jgi:hypothetical protein
MAGKVQLVVEANTRQAVGEFAKMTDAERKAALEFAKATRDARAYELQMQKVAAAGQRAARATTPTQRLVGGIQARTRADNLTLTQAQRQALRTGSGYTGSDRSISIARSFQARELRDQRGFQQFLRRERVGNDIKWRVSDQFSAQKLGHWQNDLSQRQARRAELDGLRSEGDKEVFGARMEADRARKQKSLDRRNATAQGALAVGAAVAGVAYAADQKLTMYADKIVEVEDQLSGLYGVGDNAGNRRELRRSAISGSIGSGVSLEGIADLRGRMVSAFGDMPKDAAREAEQSALKFRKLGVQNSTDTALGLGALYGTFGDQLGGGGGAMRLLANRLQQSADVGAFDPDTVTPYLASMGQAFKGAGYKDTDMFAAAALASKTGMRAEAFTTGVRNLPLLMMEGKKKGFKQTGDFATDVGQLSKMESPELLDLVGRDVFVVAKMFADNTSQLKTYIQQQEAITSKMDTLGTKIGTMMTDSAFNTVETIRSARQLQENAPSMQTEMPRLAETVSDMEIRKAGAALTSNPLTSWFDQPATWMEGAVSSAGGYGKGKGELYAAGLNQMIASARESGDTLKGSYLSIMGGYDTGSYVTGKDGKKRYTTKADADEFIKMRTKGGYDDLSGNEYMQYMQMMAGGNEAGAKSFLEKEGKSSQVIDKFSDAVDKLAKAADQFAGVDRLRAATNSKPATLHGKKR